MACPPEEHDGDKWCPEHKQRELDSTVPWVPFETQTEHQESDDEGTRV